jgi:hypothetical protein
MEEDVIRIVVIGGLLTWAIWAFVAGIRRSSHR